MFALDFIPNGKGGGGPDGEHLITSPSSIKSHTHSHTTHSVRSRSRSNSMTSNVSGISGARIKAPHTEGHIKWITTL